MQLKHVYPSILRVYLSSFGISVDSVPDTPENEYLRYVLNNTDSNYFVRTACVYQCSVCASRAGCCRR